MERLFSYGTLRQKDVQLANFGRELDGQEDCLPGYRVGTIRITDKRVLKESGKEYHPILKYTGDSEDLVAGSVFELSPEELLRADDYEVDAYVRIQATLESGRSCWIYAAAGDVA